MDAEDPAFAEIDAASDELDRAERELDEVVRLLWPKPKKRPAPGVYALISAAHRMRDIARRMIADSETRQWRLDGATARAAVAEAMLTARNVKLPSVRVPDMRGVPVPTVDLRGKRREA